MRGQVGLAGRQRDADGADAVVLGRVQHHAAPAAADVEQPHARLEPELAADELVLGRLRVLERVVGSRQTAHEYVIDGPSTSR